MNELNTYIPSNIRLITRSLSGSHPIEDSQSEQDTTYILQERRDLEALRKEVWPEPVPLEQKLHDCEDD